MDGREYVRLRRRARNRRPLPRQGGGRKLGFILAWCRKKLRISKGALARELADELGTTRGRIYRVMRGELGLSPDALWRLGRALNKLGVWQMSGPLALAMEPRYDSHLLGAVGELVLDPMHFVWRGDLYDFLWNRSWFREQNDLGLQAIENFGVLVPPLQELFHAAWERWYALDAAELAIKENETRFADKAPAISRAISLLRAQQRDDDATTYERSYRLLIHDANKDIRAYFEVGGSGAQPPYPRRKFPVEESPRFHPLSDDRLGNTNFGKRLRSLIAPNGNRTPPSEAYRNGWSLRVPESSGLLALALLDYEREFYLLIARIVKPLFPRLERLKRGEQTQSDVEELRQLRTWWKSLCVIACLVGPLDEGLVFLSEELAYVLEGKFDVILTDETWPSVHWGVLDLHEALFADSSIGNHLRKLITLPNDAAIALSRYQITSEYKPSDYDSLTTPEKLATVLDMLHQTEFGYPTGTTRIELFWWLRDIAGLLDALN